MDVSLFLPPRYQQLPPSIFDAELYQREGHPPEQTLNDDVGAGCAKALNLDTVIPDSDPGSPNVQRVT